MRRSLSSTQSPDGQAPKHGGVLALLIVALTVIIVIAVIAFMIYAARLAQAIEKSIDEAIKNLYVTDPARIERLRKTFLDITVPPEFAPLQAYSFLEVTSVSYHWCPSRNCRSTSPSMLRLLSFPEPTSEDAPDWETAVQNELTSRFSDYFQEDRIFDLPGQRVRFAFVSVYDDDTPETPTDDADELSTTPADAMLPSNVPTHAHVRLWWIHGEVRGKFGRCSIELQLEPEVYDQELIMTMIQSIR